MGIKTLFVMTITILSSCGNPEQPRTTSNGGTSNVSEEISGQDLWLHTWQRQEVKDPGKNMILTDGWQGAQSNGLARPGFYIDKHHRVHLFGSVEGGKCPGTILILPKRARPAGGVRFFSVNAGNQPVELAINPFDGSVRATAPCRNSRLSLDGISFFNLRSTVAFENATLGGDLSSTTDFGLTVPAYGIDPEGIVHMRGTVLGKTCQGVLKNLPEKILPEGVLSLPAAAMQVKSQPSPLPLQVRPFTPRVVRQLSGCFKGRISLDQVRYPSQTTGGVDLNLKNSWSGITAFGLAKPRAFRDSTGRVYLQGTVSGKACNGIIAELPADLVPARGVRVFMAAGDQEQIPVLINPFNRAISIGSCKKALLSLDGISFKTR